MKIIYADDDQLSLDIVLRALQARGHQVYTINTSHGEAMLQQFEVLLDHQTPPQIIILDGHNLVLDAQGQVLFDLQPALLVAQLRQQGLSAEVKLVLYSSDEGLINEARNQRSMGFSAAVPKVGNGGGLMALLAAVETQY